MKNFMSASEAKTETFNSLNRAIEKESSNLQQKIQDAVNNGDFKIEWEINSDFEEKHISRMIEMLFESNFAVYNENKRLVNLYDDGTFVESKILTISWEMELEEAQDRESILARRDYYLPM